MIGQRKRFFERDHHDAHRGVAPVHLCELVVHCLELVRELSARGLDFRFKGGNSQLLLLEEPQRFSIDVDIVTLASKEVLTDLVARIVEEGDVFTRHEVRQHKTKPWLPMISFKLFFDSHYQTAEEAYVMLDAVLEKPAYPGVRKPIRCGTLFDSLHDVEVPTVSGLIADKLLCIGPSTMGIPLGKKKEAQRLKHVFDVAVLSRREHEIEAVRSGLATCMAQENELQRSSWSLADVVTDTRKFCSAALHFDAHPDPSVAEPGTYLDEIVRGFGEFRSFPFRVDYTWPRFREDCQCVLVLLDKVS